MLKKKKFLLFYLYHYLDAMSSENFISTIPRKELFMPKQIKKTKFDFKYNVLS